MLLSALLTALIAVLLYVFMIRPRIERLTHSLNAAEAAQREAADRLKISDEKIALLSAAIDQEGAARVRAEVQLKQRTDEFNMVFNSVPALIWIKDKENRILRVNQTAADALARPASEIEGRSTAEFYPDEAEAYHRDDLEVIVSEKPKIGIVEQVRTTGGEKRWIQTDKVPFRDVNGTITGVMVVAQDITARKQLEAQTQHAQRLESLGVLAGGIAHDFNNLLAGILGNADLSLIELKDPEKARARIADIKTAGIRASELTRQMLAYSGRGKFVIETLSLNRVVHELGRLLQTSISKKAVLKYDLFEDTPAIDADAAQIRQVVMNLIVNASEALGDNSGVITLKTGVVDAEASYLADAFLAEGLAEGRYAYLEISDTGCGMNKETLARIFDPFFSTKFTGRGLGLAAVLGIVRGHNGALKVYSEPGQGTSFKLLFPGSQALYTRNQATPPPTHWRGSGRILVVDDEEILREVNRHALTKYGFTVATAFDGKDAVEIFRRSPRDFRLVILDMTMPRMSGEEAFRELRALNPDVKVLLTSGYNEQDATQRFVGTQLAGFIQKPFQISALIEKVCEILGESSELPHTPA